MPVPHDTVDKLEQTYRSISALGAELDEAQWELPTELPGWSVKDNLSHLIGTERSLQGLAVADHTPAESSHVKNPIGEFNEREVDSRRGRSGAEVLAEWDELIAQRIDTLRNGDASYYDAETMTPTGPGTVADFLDIRVLDLWSHEQDIRRAVGKPGGYDHPSAAHTIDRLIRTLPIVIGKRAGTPEGAAVRVEITGPVARSLLFEVRGGRATPVDTPSTEPVASVSMDSETFTVLALGRAQAAALEGGIELAGDADLGRRIVHNLAMMI
jgi:uncharacterized protein (TIGR03083 family)